MQCCMRRPTITPPDSRGGHLDKRAGCKYSKAVYGKWVGLISPCVQREHNVFTESTIGMGSLSVGEALGKPALSKRTARDGTVARLRPTPCR